MRYETEMAMELHVLPWIKKDIAIEIISRMSAEQVEQLYQLLTEFEWHGFEQDSQEVINNPRYQQLMNQISQFKAEIDQIYEGSNLEELYRKVDEEYVPHLNRQRGQEIVAA